MTDQRIKYLKDILKLTAVDYTFVSRVEEKGVNNSLSRISSLKPPVEFINCT